MFNFRKTLIATALAAFPAISAVADAATLNFTYTLPTARVDGTALAITDLASCQLMDVTVSPAVKLADIPVTATSYAYTLTSVGTSKSYAMTCTDKFGSTSGNSNVVKVSTSLPKPSTLQVTINYTTTGTTP